VKSLSLRPKALEDFDGIWLHIAQDNMQAADALIDHFEEIFQTLCHTPFIGLACPQLASDIRRFPSRGYVVFYSVENDFLIIERILHGARDMEALFE
jgi:toxin ParE1/3/4